MKGARRACWPTGGMVQTAKAIDGWNSLFRCHAGIWVVLQRVPFWVPNIVRHPCKMDPKGDPIFRELPMFLRHAFHEKAEAPCSRDCPVSGAAKALRRSPQSATGQGREGKGGASGQEAFSSSAKPMRPGELTLDPKAQVPNSQP